MGKSRVTVFTPDGSKLYGIHENTSDQVYRMLLDFEPYSLNFDSGEKCDCQDTVVCLCVSDYGGGSVWTAQVCVRHQRYCASSSSLCDEVCFEELVDLLRCGEAFEKSCVPTLFKDKVVQILTRMTAECVDGSDRVISVDEVMRVVDFVD